MQGDKACPVLLREKHGRQEILAFKHPKAGFQLVKGTIEAGEDPAAAALRELAEESGVADAVLVRALGTADSIVAGQRWHFFLCRAEEQPARWVYIAPDDGGQRLSFFWQDLAAPLEGDWHGSFVAAVAYIKVALDNV